MRWAADHKRKKVASYQTDDETEDYLHEMRQPKEYSALIRELIKERHTQERIAGLRDAVVKLISEYKQANGIGEG